MATGPAPRQVDQSGEWETVNSSDEWETVPATSANVAPAAPPAQPGMLEPHGKWNLGDVLRGAGAGIKSLVDPQTWKGMADPIINMLPSYANGPMGIPVPVPNIKGSQANMEQGEAQLQQAEQHPSFTAGSIAGPALLTHGIGKFIPKVAEAPGKMVRAGQEAVTRTSPSDVANLVRETSAKNVEEVTKAGEANKKAAADHLEKTQEALHETKGRELAYQQDVKSAHETADEAQKTLDKQHGEAVQKSLQETREKEDLYQHELRKAKAESEDAYQKKLAEVEQKRAKAEHDRNGEIRRYLLKKGKIQSDFSEAQAKFKTESARQGKIEPTQAKLKTSWSNLRAGVETAREKALGVGNAQYSGVNEALSHIESDPETYGKSLEAASESLRGSKSEPTILKQMSEKWGKGEVPTYADLQGDYSRLGREISKGSLDGDVFHAYDKLHEALGDEMQRIADSEGQGAALKEARNYWRRMKQTFGKPFNPTDAATSTTEKAAPNVASAEEQANRIRLLGSFDPDIASQFNHIENIRKGAESLPKPVSEQSRLKGLVEERKPLPPRPGPAEAIPTPESISPREVPAPTRAEIPPRPGQVLPKLPNLPERVAPPDRPPETPAKTTTLTPQTLSDLKGANVDKASESFRAPNRLASTFLGYDLMRNAFNALGNAADLKFGSAAKDLFKSARDVGIRVGYAMGSGKMADLLERSAVRESLSQITDRDIAQLKKLPPDQQAALGSELKALVDAAQKKGVKVSSPLLGWIGAAAGAAAPKNRPGDILPKTQ